MKRVLQIILDALAPIPSDPLRPLREAMESEELYLIMAAVRGPDSGDPISSIVKDLTTKVIRWSLGAEEVFGISPGAARHEFDSLRALEEDLPEKITAFLDRERHFLFHLRAAAEVLLCLGDERAFRAGRWTVDSGRRRDERAFEAGRWIEEFLRQVDPDVLRARRVPKD